MLTKKTVCYLSVIVNVVVILLSHSISIAQVVRSASPENLSQAVCGSCLNTGEIQDSSTCTCACPGGTEVCAGSCVSLCSPQRIRDNINCNCECNPSLCLVNQKPNSAVESCPCVCDSATCPTNQTRKAFPGCDCACDSTACPKNQVRGVFPGCACGCPTSLPNKCADGTCIAACGASKVFNASTCKCECVSPLLDSNGYCCPAGQERVGTKNSCCPPLRIAGTGATATCCLSTQRVVGAVCKEKCYQTTFTTGVNVDSDYFNYNTSSGGRLACLENRITNIYASLQSGNIVGSKTAFTITDDFSEAVETGDFVSVGRKWADDNAIRALWDSFLRPISGCPAPVTVTCLENFRNVSYQTNRSYIDCDNVKADGTWDNWHADDKTNGFGGGTTNQANVACHNGNFVLDANCRLIKQSDVASKCGGSFVGNNTLYYYASTPISLILDESHDIHADVSFVSIPLNPNSDKNFWLWKGSDKAPLLVYDPKHEGKITSAAQLFGNWTFGGQKLASLFNKNQNPIFSKTPWENGFKALATLDANSDNKISGAELAPLALWFDGNKDAVSQPGEIKTLESVEITALYYTVDKDDLVNKAVEVTKGFERTVSGKTVVGKAIDWSSEGADTQFELLTNHLLGVNASSDNKQHVVGKHADNKSDVGQVTSSSNEATSGKLSQLSGLWSWGLEGGKKGMKNGYFMIDSHDDKIKGYSLMEIPFAVSDGNSGEKQTMVRFSRLNGEKSVANGATVLTFNSETPSGKIESVATLSADGTTMSGKSMATVDVDGKSKIVHYTWKATKH